MPFLTKHTDAEYDALNEQYRDLLRKAKEITSLATGGVINGPFADYSEISQAYWGRMASNAAASNAASVRDALAAHGQERALLQECADQLAKLTAWNGDAASLPAIRRQANEALKALKQWREAHPEATQDTKEEQAHA